MRPEGNCGIGKPYREQPESVVVHDALALLWPPARRLYAALNKAENCRAPLNSSICDRCWNEVENALDALRSMRP